MCRCDHPTCAAKVDDGRASNVTIHIIGDNEALDAAHDQKMHGRGIDLPPARTQPAKPEPGAESEANEPKPVKTAEPAANGPNRAAQPVRPRTAALIPGANGAIVPAPLLAELLAYGAKVRFVGAPSPGEDRYRPSTALQEFVRTRDLTCRFPGCDRPAVAADIDHTVPWPAGATHPANTKCYCRLHHLGQRLSGTAGPTARISKPFSSVLFPQWNTAHPPGRHLMVPPPTHPVTFAARHATCLCTTGSPGSLATSSGDGGAPAAIRCAANDAIIAPLSVHSRGRGIRNVKPAAAQRSSASSRSREFAATPPAISSVDTPSSVGRPHRLHREHVGDRLLEARGHVGLRCGRDCLST